MNTLWAKNFTVARGLELGGGSSYATGTVTEADGTAGPYLLRLYNRSDGALVASQLTGEDGRYVVRGLPDRPLVLVAHDLGPSPKDVVATERLTLRPFWRT